MRDADVDIALLMSWVRGVSVVPQAKQAFANDNRLAIDPFFQYSD
jgi:hypothetical protein